MWSATCSNRLLHAVEARRKRGPCHLIVTIRKFTITPVQFLPILNERATCAGSPFEGISCVHLTHNRVKKEDLCAFGGFTRITPGIDHLHLSSS